VDAAVTETGCNDQTRFSVRLHAAGSRRTCLKKLNGVPKKDGRSYRLHAKKKSSARHRRE